MKQAEFESLACGTVSALRGIRDEKTLLAQARRLADAEAAVLITRESEDNEGRPCILAVDPPDYQRDLERHLDKLRAWYSKRKVPRYLNGFTNEGPLDIGRHRFADALVAFGTHLLSDGPPWHELILLKSVDKRQEGARERSKAYYSSYHCWVVAQLLYRFEQKKTTDSLIQETHIKKQYSTTLTKEVLPDEPWSAIKSRIKELSKQGASLELRWTIYLIWVAYQVRKIRAGKTPAKGFKGHLFEKEERKEILDDPPKEPFDLFSPALDFLLSKDKDIVPGETFIQTLCENISHFRLASPRETEKTETAKPGILGDDGLWFSQITALVLEHAWGNVLEAALAKKKARGAKASEAAYSGMAKEDLSGIIASTRRLLGLTRAVVIQALVSQPASPGDGSPSLREIGRESLRLYFAQEVVRPGSRIEQLYLGGEQKTVRREAPTELKRTFLVHLSRFMLGVVAVLERRLQIRTSATATLPPVIRPSEELDSLLYLVDRLAHVELEVDERLYIREHLARQVTSEIHHYLSRPYYRDHLLHVIDVFLLGHLLLNTEVPWIKGQQLPWVKHLCQRADRKGRNRSMPALKRDWLRNWAVAGLLHDIGYQVGQGDDLAQAPEVWRAYFDLTGPGSVWSFRLPDRVDSHGLPDPLEYVRRLAEDLSKLPGLKGCLPESDDGVLRDHGFLSALRVAQVMAHAEGGARQETEGGDSLSDRYYPAIHAIAYHNMTDKTVAFNANPLACLLRLCDELQEWDRRRVNMEKLLKGLYLDLQEGQFGEIPAHQMLDAFEANLEFKPQDDQPCPVSSMKICLKEKENKPHFVFKLLYRDPVDGYFDPAMTVLCKAYKLQHMDLDVSSQGLNDLHFRIALHFPLPQEYGARSEYDIYALFTEQVRCLPLLREYPSVRQAEPGLVHLVPLERDSQMKKRQDAFGIVLTRAADQRHHYGWLPVDPAHFFKDFVEFKKSIFAGGVERK